MPTAAPSAAPCAAAAASSRCSSRTCASCRRRIAGVIADRDVVLTMGAGSIGAVAHELPSKLGVTSARAGR